MILILVLALGPGAAQASPAPQQPQPLTIQGSPLTLIVGANASMQIYHEQYFSGQVFGDADSGIFFWVNGLLYGSNLAGTQTVTAANFTLPLTTLSHKGPAGAGTTGDPWVITTLSQVGDTGLEVEQKVSYVNGSDYFRIDWRISNHSPTNIEFDFFHAADLYFTDSDFGYGYFDPVSGGVGGADIDRTWYMMFVPAQTPTAYQEGPYSTIWGNIGSCFDGECILGPGLDKTVLREDYLDNGVGLQWHRSLGAGESTALADWWSFGTRPIVPPEAGGPLEAGRQSEFFSSIPTPLQISTDPEVIATNLFLAGFLGLLFGILSTVFNNTLQENRDEVNRLLFGWLPKVKVPTVRMQFPTVLRWLARLLVLVLFLLLSGLINSFLDPAFQPFTTQGLGIFLTMLLSIGAINLLDQGTKVLTARGLKLDAGFKIHPAAVLVAVFCVLASRSTEFLPGYLFGVMGGLALAPGMVSHRRQALVSGSGLVVALLAGIGAWILTIPLGLLLQATASFLPLQVGLPLQVVLGALQSLLLLVFVVALENAFFELLPLAVTAGSDIFTWNKIVWFLAFVPVFFLFYHIFLNPDGAFFAGVNNKNTLLLSVLLLVYALLTLGVWLFFRLRRKGQPPV